MILTQEPDGSQWRWHAPAGFVAREVEPFWRNDSQQEYPYNECQRQQQKMQVMYEMRQEKKSKRMKKKRKRKKKESTWALEGAWFYGCVATLTPEDEPTTFREKPRKNNNGKKSNYQSIEKGRANRGQIRFDIAKAVVEDDCSGAQQVGKSRGITYPNQEVVGIAFSTPAAMDSSDGPPII